MSNWGSMVSELQRMVKMDSTITGSVADSDSKRAIVESILYNRRRHLGFNQATAVIAIENGVQRYPMPRDYLALTGPVFWSNVPTSTSDLQGRKELINRPLAWVEKQTYRIPGSSEYRFLGDSVAYAIDPQSREIVLSPVPGSSISQLDFHYLRDPGTPGMSASSGAWTFTKPWSEDAIADAFTNDWFEIGRGYHLVLNRAAYLLWARIYGGTEESVAFQENALRLWGEELARLTGEASRYTSSSDIRPRL